MFKIEGFWLKQRVNSSAPKVFVGHVNVKELFKYSTVDVITRDRTGIQRLLIPGRVKKIVKFFEDIDNESNIIPNSITISIEKPIDAGSTENELCFTCTDDEKFIKIIDGQHRIEGMNACAENMEILLTAFIEPSAEEKAFQFVVINNKSHKVPTLHVKSLIANFSVIEDILQKRLNNVGISFSHVKDVDLVDNEDDSPLRGFVLWPNNPEGLINITSIEVCFKYIQDRIPECRDDDALKRDIFYQIWNGIKLTYPTLWDKELPVNHLFDKSVFIVLTIQLIDSTFAYCDNKREFTGDDITIFDNDIFVNSTKAYLKDFPIAFWTIEWSKKGLDTSAGRNLITRGLQQVKDNIRSQEDELLNNNILV